MTLYHRFNRSPWVPWRIRNGMELWLERRGRVRHPRLYQWLHFGRWRDPVIPVTRGPRHHFFGYYEKSPWNASQRFLLAHEAGFNDRPPGPDDVVTVGLVDLQDPDRPFRPLGQSLAWNWQQGSMLQWHLADPENLLVHNDRRQGQARGVVRDTSGRELAVIERPIYALDPDGRHAYSLNFARLHRHRPGYGYAGLEDPFADQHHPADDGIWRIDLDNGRAELIVSLDQLARLDPTPAMAGVHHWINHIQVAPDGSRLAFFHIWRVGEDGWRVRLYTSRPDGTQLSCLLDAEFVSHYDWQDAEHILIWAHIDGRKHFWLLGLDGSRRVIGDGILDEDGHCSFSPDGRWVLNDTYPDRHGLRTLMLWRWPDGPRIDLARLHSPKERWWGEIRCDLHPRWSRDGRTICIDSVHDGTRQIYLMDVSRHIGEPT